MTAARMHDRGTGLPALHDTRRFAPHTLAAMLCLAAMLLWAIAAPALAFAESPDRAGDQGRPDDAGEAGAPDHAERSGTAHDGTDSEQEGSEEEGSDDASDSRADARDDGPEGDDRAAPAESEHRAERSGEVRDGQQGERQLAEPPEARQNGDGGEAEQAEKAEQAGEPNRGSIKVRATGEETWPPRHEPHVDDCEFWIHFHGFDADERDVRIYAWAPTGDQQLVHEGSISLDEARGNEVSGIYPADADDGLTLEDLAAAEDWPGQYEPHEQHGWHLRVEVEGPKHKMLWLDCPVDVEEELAVDAPDDQSADEVGEEEDAAITDESDVDIEDVEEEEEEEEEFGIGGPLPEDEAAVLSLILEDDQARAVRAVQTADADVEVAGVVEEADEDVLPVTGSSLAWLAALGLLFGVIGARMVAATRPAAGRA